MTKKQQLVCTTNPDLFGLDDLGAVDAQLVGDDELAGAVGSAFPWLLGLAVIGVAGYYVYTEYFSKPASAATSGWGLATIVPSASLQGPPQLVGAGWGLATVEPSASLAEGTRIVGATDGPGLGGLAYAAAHGAPVGLASLSGQFGGTVFGS